MHLKFSVYYWQELAADKQTVKIETMIPWEYGHHNGGPWEQYPEIREKI